MARLGSLTEACRGASDGTQMMIGSIGTDAQTKGGYGYRTMWLGSKLRPQIASDLRTNKAGATRLHAVQPSLIMEQNLQDCMT